MADKTINRVVLLGRVASDPDFRTTPSGIALCRLRIQTNEPSRENDQWVDRPAYHTVVLWRGIAEVADKYLNKGDKVYVEGSLNTRSWEDRETGQTRWITEVKGKQLILLGGRGRREESSYGDEDRPRETWSNTSQGGGYGSSQRDRDRGYSDRRDAGQSATPGGGLEDRRNPYTSDDTPPQDDQNNTSSSQFDDDLPF